MVQYASFGNFNSNSRNIQNFDLALIFIVMHHTSSYVSINSCNILDSYRMSSFFPAILVTFFAVFMGYFSIYRKNQNKKMALENCEKSH